MAELKPCPFCGREAVVEKKPYSALPIYKVVADHDCLCPFCELEWSGGYSTKEEAEAAWNQRLEVPPVREGVIHCKDCKHYSLEVGDESYALGYCPFIQSHLVMSKGFCAWAERRSDDG